jgi:DNA-directed RNA polymerase subunit RPC12/RpoP
MATYTCAKCGMSVNATCAKCNTPLVHDHLDKNGQKIQISKCPKCQGKIKSPQCCGADMKA